MLYFLLLVATCVSLQTSAAERTTTDNNKVDLRTFLQNQDCNKKNAQGHTFFYQLARDCSTFGYAEDIMPEIENYLKNNDGYLPNPFIKNETIVCPPIYPPVVFKVYNTAKEEALSQFTATGNPVCGTLIKFFDQAETMFSDLAASKKFREQLISGKIINQVHQRQQKK